MKRNTSIKLKAAFLFSVFVLNTVVGFACSVGVDMGFNTKHHDDDNGTKAVVHIHKDGKKHVHQEKKEKHDEANTHSKSNKDKDNCCKDKVKEFQDIDKSLPHSFILSHPVFLTAFVSAYYNITLLPYTDVVKDIKHFVRSYHPPIQDIRIAIQSFQI